jgi:circadian clock protein KaiB
MTPIPGRFAWKVQSIENNPIYCISIDISWATGQTLLAGALMTMGRNRHTMPLKATEVLPKRHGRKAVVKKLSTSRSAKAAVTTAEEWDLRLYIAGSSPKSAIAFLTLKRLCDEHLAGRYQIEIVDLTKNPQLEPADQIVGLPALLRKGSFPIRKIIGCFPFGSDLISM